MRTAEKRERFVNAAFRQPATLKHGFDSSLTYSDRHDVLHLGHRERILTRALPSLARAHVKGPRQKELVELEKQAVDHWANLELNDAGVTLFKRRDEDGTVRDLTEEEAKRERFFTRGHLNRESTKNKSRRLALLFEHFSQALEGQPDYENRVAQAIHNYEDARADVIHRAREKTEAFYAPHPPADVSIRVQMKQLPPSGKTRATMLKAVTGAMFDKLAKKLGGPALAPLNGSLQLHRNAFAAVVAQLDTHARSRLGHPPLDPLIDASRDLYATLAPAYGNHHRAFEHATEMGKAAYHIFEVANEKK